MNEQIIILTFLIIAVGATLLLYISKAVKQVKYKGDERWQLIQLRANTVANIVNGGLIILLAILPLFINSQNCRIPASIDIWIDLFGYTQSN